MTWIAVFDTNILISALLSTKGEPFRCLTLAKVGLIESVTCEEILVEFKEKLETKFEFAPEYAQEAVEEVRKISKVVKIPGILQLIKNDPDDNMILECAEAGKADFIVTGDRRHLLTLKKYKDIPIVTAVEFSSKVINL